MPSSTIQRVERILTQPAVPGPRTAWRRCRHRSECSEPLKIAVFPTIALPAPERRRTVGVGQGTYGPGHGRSILKSRSEAGYCRSRLPSGVTSADISGVERRTAGVDRDNRFDLAVCEGVSSGLLDHSDVVDAAPAINPGASAGIVVFENRWATESPAQR